LIHISGSRYIFFIEFAAQSEQNEEHNILDKASHQGFTDVILENDSGLEPSKVTASA